MPELKVLPPARPALLKKDHEAYELARSFMEDDLARSGLSPKDLDAEPALWQGQPGYIIPYHHSGYWRFRLHRDCNEILRGKYRSPYGQAPGIYLPRSMTVKLFRNARVKYICEGEKKAAALWWRYKVPVCGIGGCAMWSEPGTRMTKLLPELQSYLRPHDRVLVLADSDIETNWNVSNAFLALRGCLRQAVSEDVDIRYVPPPAKGVDDWLVENPDSEDLADVENWQLHYGVSPPTVEELRKRGVRFRMPKEGDVTLQHMQPDANTSSILGEIVLENLDEWLRFDQHIGRIIDNTSVSDLDMATTLLEQKVNFYFPGIKTHRGALRATLLGVINKEEPSSAIADYVRSITWDGKPRLESWLPELMVTDNPLAGRIGAMFMCGYYARLTDPGCKMDHMLVLQGPQGIGKSTALEILGLWPMHNGHISMTVDELMQKDVTVFNKKRMATVINVDDLETLRHKEQGKLKAILTSGTMESRMMYTETMKSNRLACVYVGSTNHDVVFSDPTGLRRFLTVKVSKVHLSGRPYVWSTATRDQILAEVGAKWEALRDTWWQQLSADDITINSMKAANPSPLEDVLKEMLEDGIYIEYRGRKYVTCEAIIGYAGDERNWTRNMIGRRMRYLCSQPASLVHVGQVHRLHMKAIEEFLPEGHEVKFMPANKVAMLNCYPVELR